MKKITNTKGKNIFKEGKVYLSINKKLSDYKWLFFVSKVYADKSKDYTEYWVGEDNEHRKKGEIVIESKQIDTCWDFKYWDWFELTNKEAEPYKEMITLECL